MEKETIDYKVNIDTSSLADQLQNIKNQVDQAMATYTFRSSTPEQYAPSFTFPTAQVLGNSPITQFGQDLNTGSNIAVNQVRQMAETTRLGFQKFTQDIQNVALSIPINYPTPAPLDTPWKPDMQSWGPWKTGFEAMTGWGYSPKMSTTSGDYVRQAQNKFEDNALKNGFLMYGDIAGTAIGGMLGSATLIPGMGMIGSTIGGTLGGAVAKAEYGLFASTIGQDFEASQNMRSYIRDTSWRTLGGRISGDRAGEMAEQFTHLGRTKELEGFRVGLKDVQDTMRLFTEAGGFDFTRTSSEFADKMKLVVGSIEQVKQVLKVSKEEAARIISDMQMMGIGNTAAGTIAAAQNIQAQAYAAGYTPQEFMQYGQQTAEIVRGTGVNLGSAFLGGMETLASVREAARDGRYSKDLIMQYGGIENLATTINRSGYEFGMSMNGFTSMAAQKFYGEDYREGNIGVYDKQIGAISAVGGSVANLLRMRGEQSKWVSGKTGEELFLNESIDEMKRLAFIAQNSGDPNLKITEDMAVGMLSLQGIGENKARLMYKTAQDTGGAARLFIEQQNANRQTLDLVPSLPDRLKDKFENTIAESPVVQTINEGAGMVNYAITKTGRGVKILSDILTKGAAMYQTDNQELRDVIKTTDFTKITPNTEKILLEDAKTFAADPEAAKLGLGLFKTVGLLKDATWSGNTAESYLSDMKKFIHVAGSGINVPLRQIDYGTERIEIYDTKAFIKQADTLWNRGQARMEDARKNGEGSLSSVAEVGWGMIEAGAGATLRSMTGKSIPSMVTSGLGIDALWNLGQEMKDQAPASVPSLQWMGGTALKTWSGAASALVNTSFLLPTHLWTAVSNSGDETRAALEKSEKIREPEQDRVLRMAKTRADFKANYATTFLEDIADITHIKKSENKENLDFMKENSQVIMADTLGQMYRAMSSRGIKVQIVGGARNAY